MSLNKNGKNYYKVIYMFTSASYEPIKTEMEQIIIRSYIFLNQHLMSLKKMEQIIIRSYNYTVKPA